MEARRWHGASQSTINNHHLLVVSIIFTTSEAAGREQRKILHHCPRCPVAPSAEAFSALFAHTPQTRETSAAGTPLRRGSPEDKWRRTSQPARWQPTNCVPPR